MDAIERKIISELLADGRLTLTELSERIGLSLSSCHRRVKALEESGAIRGYRADIDASRVGLKFTAIVFVTLKNGDRASIKNFEEEIQTIPEITKAQRLFGDPDYLLQVVTWDLESFQELYDRKLSALVGVQRLTSTIVMKNVVQDRILPL
jgi:DNA-binding Lrp family transcriptional regulator